METDLHNITFKWGRGVSGASRQEDTEAQETIREMMKQTYIKSRFNKASNAQVNIIYRSVRNREFAINDLMKKLAIIGYNVKTLTEVV